MGLILIRSAVTSSLGAEPRGQLSHDLSALMFPIPVLTFNRLDDVLTLLICSSVALDRKSVSKDYLGKCVVGNRSYSCTCEHSRKINTMWEINTFTLFSLGDEICFHLLTVIKDDVCHGSLDASYYCFFLFCMSMCLIFN